MAAIEWFRLWHDMPNDPKWRTVARVSGQPISLVLAVALHLMADASRNVTRGHVTVTAEDVASALDVTERDIVTIMDAMQGRVLDGNRLSGWDKRQPKREDVGNPETGAKSAAERKREQREREKQRREDVGKSTKNARHEKSRDVTLDTDTDTDKDKNIEDKTTIDVAVYRGREAETSSSVPLPVTVASQAVTKPPHPAEPDNPLDTAPTRVGDIAKLLKANGADPASHPSSKGIADMVALNLTDTEILLALQTAKQNRQAAGNPQAVTAAYVLGIARGQRQDRQKTARSPPTAAQRRSDWGARMAAVVADATAPPEPPRTIDMGVIDASIASN